MMRTCSVVIMTWIHHYTPPHMVVYHMHGARCASCHLNFHYACEGPNIYHRTIPGPVLHQLMLTAENYCTAVHVHIT